MIVGTLEPLDFNAVGNFVKLQLQANPVRGGKLSRLTILLPSPRTPLMPG